MHRARELRSDRTIRAAGRDHRLDPSAQKNAVVTAREGYRCRGGTTVQPGSKVTRFGRLDIVASREHQKTRQDGRRGGSVAAAEFAIIAAMRLAGSIALLLLMSAAAAHAQFYDLDGAYRCLKTPDAQCEKDLADRPTQAPPAPPPKPVAPDVGAAIAHVRDKTVGPKDIETLTHAAEGNDSRAVEVLAWCKLNGLGTARDPVGAYWLYRLAAGLNVPHARENQIAVFEKQLTPEQRQQVLTEENSRKKP